MARFESQVYTKIRGSVGGVTYSSNQYAPLLCRARRSPVNPNTNYQSLIRSAFSGASDQWLLLPDIDRQEWADYADTLTFEGPMGTYNVSGRSVFIGNISLAMFINSIDPGIMPVLGYEAPQIAGFLTPATISPVAPMGPPPVTGIGVNCNWGFEEEAVMWSTRSFAFNPSRYRYKGPYLPNTSKGLALDAAGSFVLDFTGLIDQKIFFTRTRLISSSPPFRTSAEYYLRHVSETIEAP